MGRIVTPVRVANFVEPTREVLVEQSQATVDMVRLRLAKTRHLDLK
jgi:hypothetical protein